MKTISLNGDPVGPGHLPYIVAELSANHNGSFERAQQIIEAAAEAGADAVKLQTYRPDTITLDCDRPEFQITEGLWAGKRLYELYEWAHMPWEWHAPLFEYAHKIGITIFSSPFDFSAVELLEKLDTPAYKIASFEIVDLPLIRCVAETGKPIILSTGTAGEDEIQEAIETARSSGCQDLILLHCVSAYPAMAEDYNLKTIPDMAKRFDVPIGLSDHTLDNATAVAATALGACMVEKHFTLCRDDQGPDDSFSLEPQELKKLCKDVKIAWSAIGQVNYELKPGEKDTVKLRRSLYVVQNIRNGEIFTKENVRSIRPGLGLPPKYLDEILGKTASCDIAYGTPLDWSMVKNISS